MARAVQPERTSGAAAALMDTLVFLFSDIPVYLSGFCLRWRFNWRYAVFSAAGGLVWTTAHMLLHAHMHNVYGLAQLPFASTIPGACAEAIAVACLIFGICKHSTTNKALQFNSRVTEDEIRNGLQIIVYAVTLMDQGNVYMPQVRQGVMQIEKALAKQRRSGKVFLARDR